MKYTAFTLMLAALVAAAPVQAQSSRAGKGGAAAQAEPKEAKSGVRFVICSAKNVKVKSPLWYKVNDEEAKTVTISARTATPRIKPQGGKVVFYEDNPIPPTEKEAAKDWKEPKVVFTVDTAGAASKAFCIVMPETETKVDTIMLSESDFPKKGVHLINLSQKNVKISTSVKGDFTDAKITMLKGGNTKGVSSSNKWSLTGANHGDQLAFQITYEGVKEQRVRGTGGKSIKDEKGKVRKEKVKSEITVRRSKFVVSERQSLISILVDDPAHDGVKLLSIQLAD